MRSSLFAGMLVVGLSAAGAAQHLRLSANAAHLHGRNLHLVTPSNPGSIASSLNSADPYISGFQDDADLADFSVNAPSAGLYDLAIAFRSLGRKGFAVKVNGLEIAGTIATTPARRN